MVLLLTAKSFMMEAGGEGLIAGEHTSTRKCRRGKRDLSIIRDTFKGTDSLPLLRLILFNYY